MFNKSTSRIPEAMFMQFQPQDTTGRWFADKLGEWVGSDEIVPGGSQHLQVERISTCGATVVYHLAFLSKSYKRIQLLAISETLGPNVTIPSLSLYSMAHCPVCVLQGVMEKGLKYHASDGKHTMTIGSTDAGLANFGQLTAYPSPVNVSADTRTFGSLFNQTVYITMAHHLDSRCVLLSIHPRQVP